MMSLAFGEIQKATIYFMMIADTAQAKLASSAFYRRLQICPARPFKPNFSVDAFGAIATEHG